MKKTVGLFVLFVLFVLMAGTASAQEDLLQKCLQRVSTPTALGTLTPEQQAMVCKLENDHREAMARAKAQQEQLTQQLLTPPQKPQEPRWFSPKLAMAGLLTSAAGVGVALHFGSDTKNILGNQYCVSDYGDVDYGSCSSPTQTKIGLIMIGTGATMLFLGTRHVGVSPMLAPGVKGVSGSVKWGGKK